MQKNNVKLYNIIFPVWLILLFPPIIFFVLPANYIIDFAVIFIAMRCLKMDNVKQHAKKIILRVWIFGFIADIIGSLFMFAPVLVTITVSNDWWEDNIITAVMMSPFASVWGFLWVLMCLLISCFAIYRLNYKYSFKEIDITEVQKKKISLSLAIATAPVLFFLPSDLFYPLFH